MKEREKENNKHKNGSKRWWSTLNKLTGRGQNTLVSNIISPDEINLYFQSINTDPDYSRPEQVEIPEGCRIPYIDERTVSLLLSKQKKSASGPDDLPFWLWRDYSHHLASIICSIFNCSLRKQCVPQLWKLPNITAIPKESPFSECNQLRPISLTPIIMRIFEKAVSKKEICGCLEQAIGPDQFAYEKNCNSTLALIKCQHYWLNSLDKKSNYVRVFSFDFSKAFDTVSHRIVCNKVKDLEINPYVETG